jgi:hypothetical protein
MAWVKCCRAIVPGIRQGFGHNGRRPPQQNLTLPNVVATRAYTPPDSRLILPGVLLVVRPSATSLRSGMGKQGWPTNLPPSCYLLVPARPPETIADSSAQPEAVFVCKATVPEVRYLLRA